MKLTKTAYLAFTQCVKYSWLQEHAPLLISAPEPSALRRMLHGQEVDKKAREFFTNGRLIPYRNHPEEMVPLTTEAIADGAEVLFQATFAQDDLFVKVDILQRLETGWHLIEVKSSTSVKPEHLPDVAFQLYVCEQAGIKVDRISVMHLNSAVRHPDLSNLFILADVTEESRTLQEQVAGDVLRMRSLFAKPTHPDTRIGRHCSKPYTCRFYEYCWQGVDGLTIYTIPRLNQTKESELEARDVLYVKDVPSDFPLTDTQRQYVSFIATEEISINAPAIQAELENLVYPLYFFDFETIDHPIPRFRGSKPYQQIPFQYSCHRLDVDGTVTHTEYLYTDMDDPRRPLVEAFLSDIGETGSIIVYYAPFERGRLQELAEAFPESELRLAGMIERLWDQLDIFKKHYRDHRFGHSNSLKSVLPVVVPQLSYEVLDVQNGTQAQVVWEEMLAETDTAVKEELIKQLLAYCHLDTRSMLEMHRVLSTVDDPSDRSSLKPTPTENDTAANSSGYLLLTEFNTSATVVLAMDVADWCQISSNDTKKMLSQILRELGYQATFDPKAKCAVWENGDRHYLVNHDQNKFERRR